MGIYLSKLPWYNSDNIWVTGFILYGGRYLVDNDLLDYFREIEEPGNFNALLRSANGHFSVVIRSGNEIWAATDRLRNYPLFYSSINGEFMISDDCYKLADMQSVIQFDHDAVSSFSGAGYVINNRTLIKDVFQVEAGSCIISSYGEVTSYYFNDLNEEINCKDINSGAEILAKLINTTFKDHLTAVKNKFIAVPLSGGYDSRLIAAMIARYHPDNVLCYTYGIKNNHEVAPARETAKRLGLPWINIVYDSSLIKDFMNDGFFDEYYPYISNLSSMFFLQEYFAVRYLKGNRLIPDNCVFMPGFAGDFLAGSYLTSEMNTTMGEDKISELIFRNYFRLTEFTAEKKADLIKYITEGIPGHKNEAWKVIEEWDIKEHQAKFIVNSARIFTFFGFDYVLPLWDIRLIDYCMNLPFSMRNNRKLYDLMLREYIYKDFNLNFKNEISPKLINRRIQRIKEKIKPLLPGKIRDLFINTESLIFYDKITEVLLSDIDPELIHPPRQPNFYNSYITQYYLLKTYEKFKNQG